MNKATQATIEMMVRNLTGADDSVEVLDFWRTAQGLRVQYAAGSFFDRTERTCTLPMSAEEADGFMRLA